MASARYVTLKIHIKRKWFKALERIARMPRNRALGLTVEALAALAAESQIERTEEEKRAERKGVRKTCC